jgi:hypothetical protein
LDRGLGWELDRCGGLRLGRKLGWELDRCGGFRLGRWLTWKLDRRGGLRLTRGLSGSFHLCNRLLAEHRQISSVSCASFELKFRWLTCLPKHRSHFIALIAEQRGLAWSTRLKARSSGRPELNWRKCACCFVRCVLIHSKLLISCSWLHILTEIYRLTHSSNERVLWCLAADLALLHGSRLRSSTFTRFAIAQIE